MNDMQHYTEYLQQLYESYARSHLLSTHYGGSIRLDIVCTNRDTSRGDGETPKWRCRAVRVSSGAVLWESGKPAVRGVLDRWISNFAEQQNELDKIISGSK